MLQLWDMGFEGACSQSRYSTLKDSKMPSLSMSPAPPLSTSTPRRLCASCACDARSCDMRSAESRPGGKGHLSRSGGGSRQMEGAFERGIKEHG